MALVDLTSYFDMTIIKC